MIEKQIDSLRIAIALVNTGAESCNPDTQDDLRTTLLHAAELLQNLLQELTDTSVSE